MTRESEKRISELLGELPAAILEKTVADNRTDDIGVIVEAFKSTDRLGEYVQFSVDFAFGGIKTYREMALELTLRFCDREDAKEAISIIEEIKAIEQAEAEADEKRKAKEKAEWETYLAELRAKEKEEAELKRKKTPAEKAAARLKKKTDSLDKAIEDVKAEPTDYTDSELKWIKEHLTSIRASMPARLHSWFEQRFPDCPNSAKTIIADDKMTSGGYKMSWGLGLTAFFDEEYPGTGKKEISSNSFCFDLIENKGFSFGKNDK